MLPFTDLRMQPFRGAAPTLVLLHVFGGSRRYWIEVGLLLSQTHRVLSIDTPGFGEAHAVPGYTVEAMADAFSATIAGLQPGPFVLVGHSMTGKVAAVLAARGLPGLERLVLVTPSPLSPEPIPDEARETMLAQSAGTRADAEAYLEANTALPLRNDVRERAVEDRTRANPAAWRAWLEHGSREDWSGRVGAIRIPVLVIAASKDKTLGPEVQKQKTLPHLADARMEVITGSGHMVPLEAPARLSDLLLDFTGNRRLTRSAALQSD